VLADDIVPFARIGGHVVQRPGRREFMLFAAPGRLHQLIAWTAHGAGAKLLGTVAAVPLEKKRAVRPVHRLAFEPLRVGFPPGVLGQHDEHLAGVLETIASVLRSQLT
jgi:hypothetical protein